MDDSDQSGSPAEAGPGRRDSTREGLDEAAAAFKAALAPRRAGPPGTADGGADDAGADDGDDRLPPPATQGEPPETEDMQDGEDEAAEEAQPDAVAMPASWSREDERLWSTLSPEAQARIAEREGQRDAAISLAYNIGTDAFCRSTAARHFRAGDWRGGCDALTAWNKARVNGRLVPVRGLTRRRRHEREICLRGLDTSPPR
jgi:GH24 family phage-related lysozyme (muramidase)